MANTLTITAGVNGNVNNSGVGPVAGQNTLTPIGNNFYDQSLTTPPGVWTLVATGSNFGTASVIFVANTSTTSSLQIALSASNVVNNFGIIPPITSTANSPLLIQWNNTFTGLYVMPYPSASAGLFTIVNQ